MLANIPLHFEPTPNAGEYIARGRGYALELDAGGATMHLKRGGELASLDLQLIGAQSAAAQGESPLGSVSNYFRGDDPARWRTNVPHYARVKYESVYPGVDLVYYGAGRDLEYDFIVAPGADPSQIQLNYAGAQDVRMDDEGNLRVAIDGGEVIHRKPVVYQPIANGVHASIEGAFRLVRRAASTIVAFDLGAYDARLPLVIDPVLTYSSYLGSADEDAITTIAVDAAGAVYVAGDTESANFPVTAGAPQPAHASANGSENDVFIAKINPQGAALEYSTFLGGDNNDFAADIKIDSAGTVYVAGRTSSTNFPTVSAFDTTFGGGNQADMFVAHLNAQGTALLYSTYLGGAGGEADSSGGSADLALRVDSSGSAWILSTTNSNDYPVTAGAPQTARAGDPSLFADDFVITKLAANGASLLFSTYFGGVAGEELGHGHERARAGFYVDDAGLVTLLGASGTGFPTTAGVVQPTYGGSDDIVIARIDTATNAVVFATYLGGSGFERIGGSALDAAGNIYVCGETQGPNFPTTPGAFDTTAADRDVYVAKLNPAVTSLVYSTLVGGSNADFDPMCRVDAAGAVYIAGSTGSTDFPVTAGSFDTASDFDQGFVAKLNPTGTALVYGSYLADQIDFLEINPAGEAYVAFPTTDEGLLTTPGGRAYDSGDDVYFLRLNAAGDAGLDASYVGGSGDERVDAFALAASGDVYVAGATGSDDFFTTPGAVQTVSGDAGSSTDDDAFIVRFAMGDGGSPPAAEPGVVQFSAATYSGNENGGSVTLTLTRTGGADGAISVNVASGGGSAAAGTDYTAVSETVSWADGDSAAKTVSLAITNDSADEPDESVAVALTNASGGATVGANASATVTIVDDDAATTPPAPPAPPAQSAGARGSYGGGAMGWMLIGLLVSLGALRARSPFLRLSAVERKRSQLPQWRGACSNSLSPVWERGLLRAMCAFTLSRASRDLSRQGRGAGNTLSPCGAAYAAERKEGCERARGFGRGLLPGACALLLVAGAPNAHAADDVSGWFIGLRGGIAESTLDEGDLERALAARGHNAAVSLDDQEPTWSVFGGYRWAMGSGLEAFAIDLGEYDVAINTASTNPGGLLADARSVLADAGRGAGVALSWRWAITDRFAITPRLGGYYWESERTLTSGAQRIERSENGLNAMGGIALGIQLSSAWSLAFGWDAYDAGGRNDVRAYSATVEYRFGR